MKSVLSRLTGCVCHLDKFKTAAASDVSSSSATRNTEKKCCIQVFKFHDICTGLMLEKVMFHLYLPLVFPASES